MRRSAKADLTDYQNTPSGRRAPCMSFMHQQLMLPSGSLMAQTLQCCRMAAEGLTPWPKAGAALSLSQPELFCACFSTCKQTAEVMPLSVPARERQHWFDQLAFIKKSASECRRPSFEASAQTSYSHKILNWMDLWCFPVHLILLK